MQEGKNGEKYDSGTDKIKGLRKEYGIIGDNGMKGTEKQRT
jgi:hypothetical protein